MILYADETLMGEKGEIPVISFDTGVCVGKMEIRTTGLGKVVWLFLLDDYADGIFFNFSFRDH